MTADSTNFSARAIANYFIKRSLERGDEVTHMKVQKLVYISHGWCLALLNRPLIHESVQAWEYGPVYPCLYHALKEFGKDPINEEIQDMTLENGRLTFAPASIDSESNHEEEKKDISSLLDKVWEVYNRFTAIQLSAMTHEKGTPWHDMVSKFPEIKQRPTPIPNSLIKSHYEGLSQDDNR